MRDVYVLGVGQSVFGKQPTISAFELGAQAARDAIADAGINPKELQVAYAARAIDGRSTIEGVMGKLGVCGIEMANIENACASGNTAVHQLYKDIAYGVYDIGIVVGCESITTSSRSKGLLAPPKDDLDGLLGVTMPGWYALITRHLMNTKGFTLEDIAFPSVKNHHHATLNPKALYKRELTVEDILAARMIADPITTLQCCPNADGAAAVVLCSAEVARKHTTKLVHFASSTVMSGYFDAEGHDFASMPMLRTLSKTAYEKAGIGPEDVNVVELHDAFSVEELLAYDDMGFCACEEVPSLMKKGHFSVGGKLPVNPSGGLLGLGHPLGASGVRVVCEIALHLRGDAGARQTPNAKVGVAQMIGGYLSGILPPSEGGIQILVT